MTIFPTAYFPSIALMAAIVHEKELLIEAKESFPKQTHRNRAVILTANGAMTLSVPVSRPNGNHTCTCDIGISYAEPWNIIHWRAITSAYNSSPFFLFYKDGIEKILLKRYEKLCQLNETLLLYIFRQLKIEIPIRYSEQYINPTEAREDYRDKYNYKHPDRLPFLPPYTQVFSDRMAFNGNVCILDTLFNLGPETLDYLLSVKSDSNHMFHDS